VRGLRCCISGLSASACADLPDAVDAPLALLFFIASTLSWALSYALLCLLGRGGEAALAAGSALVLPAALLAFALAPAWAGRWAPLAEPLGGAQLAAALLLTAALATYHVAASRAAQRARAAAADGDGDRPVAVLIAADISGPS